LTLPQRVQDGFGLPQTDGLLDFAVDIGTADADVLQFIDAPVIKLTGAAAVIEGFADALHVTKQARGRANGPRALLAAWSVILCRIIHGQISCAVEPKPADLQAQNAILGAE
jgi:hypothetical protein